jgi:hypothetical protein
VSARAGVPRRVGLEGFEPTSVSFVSDSVGFLLGYVHQGSDFHPGRTARYGLLARTDNGGLTWHRVAAPPVTADDSSDGSAIVRFVTAEIGFIYARRLWMTVDGGRRWVRHAEPGAVVDLEAGDGKTWLLAHTCQHCRTVGLYTMPLAGGRLQPARSAPRFRNSDVEFVRGAGTELYLQTTPEDQRRGGVWRSYDGGSWTRQRSPCKAGGSLAAWSPAGLAAVCNVILFGAGEETKRAFVSFDGAHTWTREGTPSSFGYIDDLAAGSSRGWVLDDERTEFDTTADDGDHWRFADLRTSLDDGVAGAQFTSPTHVVALPEGMPDREFFSSDDGGQVWSVTRFPLWPGSQR